MVNENHFWTRCNCGIVTDLGAKTCPRVLNSRINGVDHKLKEVEIQTSDLKKAIAEGKFFAKSHNRSQIQEILFPRN